MPELDKTYTPADVEARWYQRWLDDKCFEADPARVSERRPAYSIVIPPPNVTGVLHMGHVLNNTIQDILCRRARMLGKEVLWLPGTDHAGLATQNVVEKTLKKQGVIKHRDDLGREKLIEKIWEWKGTQGDIIIDQLKKLGSSCDWSRQRFTFDPDYNACVMRVFVDLYKKGLIYRGKRMVNWCPSSLTALSDEEVVMKAQNAIMYHFKVEVVEDDTAKPVRPRAIDISEQEEQTSHHEFTHTNRRTGLSTYITGPRFDERSGPGLSAANRRRVGQALALYRELVGAREADAHGERTYTVASAAAGLGIPLIKLPELGLKIDTAGIWQPSGDDLIRLKAGSEAQPFLDKADGVVFKIFAMLDDDGVGKKLRAKCEDGRWYVDFEKASFIESLEKLNLLHEIGGLPTEIVGITPQAAWIVSQPQAVEVPLSEYQAARAEAVANAGGIQIAGVRGLEDIRIVWHRDRAWMIGDLHAKNIMRDSSGKAVIMDALVAPVPKAMLALPAVQTAIREAKAKAGVLDAGDQADLFAAPKEKTYLTIATTRPEVIPGDQAIAVNPKDERYAHLIGKHVRRPLPVEDQALLPIIADEHVDFTFGTGVLKVTPAHDKADFEIAQRHNLPAVDVMHPNGVLNELAGKDLAGMERFAARKRAAELLAEIGSLVKEEPYQNNLGYSERADVPIESRLSEQWFLKYPSVKESQAVVANGEMKFHPDRWAKVYDHWMTGLQDWCISRQVWWGHRIPVWYRKSADQSDRTDPFDPTQEVYCGVEPPADPENWTQDPDVLDTWFSSWLWPFATMGWPEKTSTLKAFYPTTDLVTGPDIIFFWVARMIMAGFEWMGELPFKNVYFTGIIRDKQGRKMSKSLGNSPDPLELIASYSADALRFGIMRSAPLGQDIAFDEKNVELGRNFCTKLWNAARFRQMQGGEVETEISAALLSSDDKWILLRLNTAIAEVSTALDDYRFSDATATLYRFFWSEYCDWYIEASKAVLQGSDAKRKANTLAIIDFVLGHTLRLFHPFMPFITEELWHGMGFNTDLPENQGGKSIMFAPWPKPLDEDELAHFGILPEDEKTANDKYEAVNLGRGLKSTFNINKKVRFVLKPASELPAHEIEVLRILLNAEPLDVDSTFQPKKGTPAALTPLGELFLPLDGLIDVEAETARVGKEIAKVQSELEKVRAKLADTNFTAKVPQKVLDDHTQREADWSAQLAKLKTMLEALG
ncbi:MAG: valine--tRNA ligase [Prosthecobacter sp.]|uniref:valine--tRNA ligase n=1 Tax=Prosthecobacter sp. TaxID=1965333 RepID=UPI0038FEE732